jgi:hypothetical protein
LIEPRHYASLQKHMRANSDFNRQHFRKPPRDFVGLSLGNCLQHCKQDVPEKVDVAAHAVISKKNV